MLSGPSQIVKSSAIPIYIDFATAKCWNVNICYHFCLLMILTSAFGNKKIQMIWGFVETTLCLEWKIHQNIGDTFSLAASEGINLLVCLLMCLLRGTVARFRRMRRKQTDIEYLLPCLAPECTTVHQWKWAGCESLCVLDWEQSCTSKYIPKFLISQPKIFREQNTHEIVVQTLCFTGPSSSFPHLVGLPWLLPVLDTSQRIFCPARAEHLPKGEGSFWKPPKRKQKGCTRVQTSQQAFPASCWWHQLVACTRWWHSYGDFKENSEFPSILIIRSVRSSMLSCCSMKRNFSCSIGRCCSFPHNPSWLKYVLFQRLVFRWNSEVCVKIL